MLVKWYQGNSAYLDEETAGVAPAKKMDFRTSRLHLLGRYEDEFFGHGHPEWKPSKKLIEIYTQKIQNRINKVWGED